MKLEIFNQLNDADKNRILKTIMRQELDSVEHYVNDWSLLDDLHRELSSKASNFPQISLLCIQLRAKETYNVVYNFADDCIIFAVLTTLSIVHQRLKSYWRHIRIQSSNKSFIMLRMMWRNLSSMRQQSVRFR